MTSVCIIVCFGNVLVVPVRMAPIYVVLESMCHDTYFVFGAREKQ